MPRNNPSSAALPLAQTVLRILVIANWAMCAVILGVLIVSLNPDWILRALHLSQLHPERMIWGVRAVAVLGLVCIPINYLILRRLLAIVETVRNGDPFVAANALRLRAIAWALCALQLLGMVIGFAGKLLSTPDHPVHLDAGFSVNGWLAVLLTFVLAQVFAEGARMRDDLEGTV